MRYTTTPLGGAGRSVTKIVDAIVRYLSPRILEPPALGGPGSGGDEAGPAAIARMAARNLTRASC